MVGKIAVIEGLDGCGKKTQTKVVSEFLKNVGLKSVVVSLPDYGSGSSAPLRMYLNGEIDGSFANAYAASSFFAVDHFINHLKWKHEYENGGIILCDRYVTSNLIYQTSKLPMEERVSFVEWLCDFEYEKLALPRPDLVLLLDMPINTSQDLIEKRYEGDNSQKDLHEKNTIYLKECRETSFFLAKKFGWQIVSCTNTNGKLKAKKEISEEIIGIIRKSFGIYFSKPN